MLVVGGLAAYGNSFTGVLVLDDMRAIALNPSIRSLSTALSPPGACTVAGRPIANLSLAVNYALAPADARDVFTASPSPDLFLRNLWGYHALNLLIHLGAGLLLFATARRTLASPRLAPILGDAATWLAFVIALVWLVHPLQTEAVTYVVQRVESLMGLFYLLTLYCAIRTVPENSPGVGSTPRPGRQITTGRVLWSAAAIASCAVGMGTKEAMATAPLVVLLWDRLFAPPRARMPKLLFVGLGATWAVLAMLVIGEHRSPSIAPQQTIVWHYLLTQASVVLHYVRLALVPSPLVLLYSWPLATSVAALWPQVLLVTVLVATTVAGVVRRHPLAFAGAWFFLILAPTSSLLPIVTEVAAEHRMYLPLAAVIVIVVVLAFLAGRAALGHLDKAAPGNRDGARHRQRIAVMVSAVIVATVSVTCVALTRARNADYRSEDVLWLDAVTRQPDNPRARVMYGVVLMSRGRLAEAESQLRIALRLSPDDPVTESRLGAVLATQGKLDEAIGLWTRAVAQQPGDVATHRYLGEAYARQGRDGLALPHLERAIAGFPDDPALLAHVAALLAESSDATVRDTERAAMLAGRAVALTDRRNPMALEVLSVTQAALGHFGDAAATAREALQVARLAGDTALVAELEYRAAMYASRAR